MSFRILYHDDKIFFYNNYKDFQEALQKYESIKTESNNKVLITLPEYDILKKEGDEKVINKLLKYNSTNLYNKNTIEKYNNEKYKPHIALLFLGHFIPNSEKLVELQINNYLNCTFDIYIVTERNRVYGRFVDPKKAKKILNVNNVKDLNKIDENEIRDMFGKYKLNIKKICFSEDYNEECQKILRENMDFVEKKDGERLKINREVEYFKFLKAFELKGKMDKKYDFVIKTRPDLILKNQIIFCKEYSDWCQNHFLGRNNIFVIGNEKNMDWLAQVIFYYYRYDDKYGCEFQLHQHAVSKNLRFKNKPFSRLKPIVMSRYWILHQDEYFQKHTNHIREGEKEYWQLY